MQLIQQELMGASHSIRDQICTQIDQHYKKKMTDYSLTEINLAVHTWQTAQTRLSCDRWGY